MDRPSRFPDTLVLLCAMIVVALLLSWTLTPGSYQREPDPAVAAARAWQDRDGQVPLHRRLVQAREQRTLSQAALAELFVVSERTVQRWELGPPPDEPEALAALPHEAVGCRIEAHVGKLLDAWVQTGEAPTAEEIAAAKAAQIAGHSSERVIPGTYAPLPDAKRLPWHAPFLAVPRGLAGAADIIFFVFLIGGVLGVLRATGAFDALITAAIRAFGGSALPLVLGTTTLFAIGSGLVGMAEEYVPFIALLVSMAMALRLDPLVGIAIVFVGYAVGYGCAPINPFTVLVAQGIAEIEPSSGWWYRVAVMVPCLALGVHQILRYAARVQRDPSRSLVADIDFGNRFDLPDDTALTQRRVAVLAAFAATVVVFVYGVTAYGWYFQELSALFVGLGLVGALLGGLSPNEAARRFCAGAGELTTTALLIGFARAIQVILDDGLIIDTIVHGVASALEGFGPTVGAIGMLVVQTLTNLFIPSGSGQAYVTMPIMAPLADQLGIQRQVAVLAYQYGDGFTNVIVPTNAAFMGMLAMAGVPYQRWLRFAIPLMLKLYATAAISLAVAVAIGLS